MPTSDLICYQFSRDQVVAGDAKDFLSRYCNSSLPKGRKLEGMMNSMALMIDGYNQPPERSMPSRRFAPFTSSSGRYGPTGCISAIWTPRTS